MIEMSDKDFVEQFIPFRALKKAGFFNKEIKRTNYSAIVKKFLDYFGQTKREYILSQPTLHLPVSPTLQNGHFPSTVDSDGNLNSNGFHLSL